MRIILPGGDPAAAERRLVALMLNMEHAATKYGPDLAELPAPHEPWPLVSLPPQTAGGLGAAVHYRPTVGIVFYTAGASLNVGQMARRVADLLRRAPDAHLRGPRAVAATPSTVMRHRGRVVSETRIVGPRKPYKKPAEDPATEFPSRMLIWPPPDAEQVLPLHYSPRAGFTWAFMPVTAALAVQSIASAVELNAMVASVLYDIGMLARLKEGVDFYQLSIGDFDIKPLPSFLATLVAPGASLLASGWQLTANGWLPLANSALLVTFAPGGAGRLTLVGDHPTLRFGPRPYASLPARPWAPDALLADRYQCCACRAPVGGDVVVLRGARAPQHNNHREWWYQPRPPGASLLQGAQAGKDALVCLFCWSSLESAECATGHLQAELARTAAPHTQAEACARCPGYEGLAPLLGGAVRPVPGAPGAFLVEVPDHGPLVLAGEKLGPFPALTVPEIAALNAPVLAGLRLAECLEMAAAP